LLLHHALSRRRWILAGGTVVLGALLYPIPVAVLRAYYERHGGWTAASPATLYVWTSVTPVVSLALCGVLSYVGQAGSLRPVSNRPGRSSSGSRQATKLHTREFTLARGSCVTQPVPHAQVP
jgi:hypothetical protein